MIIRAFSYPRATIIGTYENEVMYSDLMEKDTTWAINWIFSKQASFLALNEKTSAPS